MEPYFDSDECYRSDMAPFKGLLEWFLSWSRISETESLLEICFQCWLVQIFSTPSDLINFRFKKMACNSGNNFAGNDVRADEQGLYKSAEGVVSLRYSAPFQPVNEIGTLTLGRPFSTTHQSKYVSHKVSVE